MLDIINRTPFEVGLFPGLDREGYDEATVLVKGTFDLRGSVAGEQVAVRHGEQFYGDPARSSVRYECDTSPAKKGTDVILVGHAHARRKAPLLEVSLAVGRIRKVARVTGDRVWYRGIGGFEASSPAPFEQMPLTWERAFGGSDTSDPDPSKHAFELQNPVGRGLSAEARGERIEGLALPNIEDPRALMEAPRDRPPPMGFGFVARSWQPRLSLAGTWDEAWRAERCPLLPRDFDPRFHSGAPADQIAEPHLRGGEPIAVVNASPKGDIRLDLPSREVSVNVRLKGRDEAHRALLDTVLIEPDEGRLVLSYRATFRCARAFLFLDRVTVTEVSA